MPHKHSPRVLHPDRLRRDMPVHRLQIAYTSFQWEPEKRGLSLRKGEPEKRGREPFLRFPVYYMQRRLKTAHYGTAKL